MNIRQILVPIDYSTCSMLVTRRAASLAAKLGARVTLLHVAELPPGVGPRTHLHPGGADVTAEAALEQDARGNLAPFVAICADEGVEATPEVRVGAVVPAILQVAQETPADLVVLGTHGRTGLARVMLGSVAEEVVRQAHVPVMLIRREPRPECNRERCDWCGAEGRSRVEEQVRAESEG